MLNLVWTAKVHLFPDISDMERYKRREMKTKLLMAWIRSVYNCKNEIPVYSDTHEGMSFIPEWLYMSSYSQR